MVTGLGMKKNVLMFCMNGARDWVDGSLQQRTIPLHIDRIRRLVMMQKLFTAGERGVVLLGLQVVAIVAATC